MVLHRYKKYFTILGVDKKVLARALLIQCKSSNNQGVLVCLNM